MSRPSEQSSECQGKARYSSPQEARRQMDRFAKRRRGKRRNTRGQCLAYRCSHCGQWHVGSESF